MLMIEFEEVEVDVFGEMLGKPWRESCGSSYNVLGKSVKEAKGENLLALLFL